MFQRNGESLMRACISGVPRQEETATNEYRYFANYVAFVVHQVISRVVRLHINNVNRDNVERRRQLKGERKSRDNTSFRIIKILEIGFFIIAHHFTDDYSDLLGE